jgi:hypothetical protein
MREAEEEIDGDRFDAQDAIPLQRLEEEEVVPSSPNARKQEKLGWGIAEGARNFCSLILGPVFVQSFVLTFLGEWGDRSQIATIALCAARASSLFFLSLRACVDEARLQNMYLVTLVTVLGHTCCTALAVVGGRYVSSKISVKYGESFICTNYRPLPGNIVISSCVYSKLIVYRYSLTRMSFLLYLLHLPPCFVCSDFLVCRPFRSIVTDPALQ